MENLTIETVKQTIGAIEHPEIANTLVELGMVRDVAFDEDARNASLTLVLPMMGIPEAIRVMLITAIQDVLMPLGVTLDVSYAEMDGEARNRFMAMSQAGWKL